MLTCCRFDDIVVLEGQCTGGAGGSISPSVSASPDGGGDGGGASGTIEQSRGDEHAAEAALPTAQHASSTRPQHVDSDDGRSFTERTSAAQQGGEWDVEQEEEANRSPGSGSKKDIDDAKGVSKNGNGDRVAFVPGQMGGSDPNDGNEGNEGNEGTAGNGGNDGESSSEGNKRNRIQKHRKARKARKLFG